MNKGDQETNISSNLKKLNNIKKRLMSKHILKDILGDDGDHTILNMEKAHKKVSREERMKINDIYRAVKILNQMFGKRREFLKTNLQKSKDRTYAKPKHACGDTYDRMMAKKVVALQLIIKVIIYSTDTARTVSLLKLQWCTPSY